MLLTLQVGFVTPHALVQQEVPSQPATDLQAGLVCRFLRVTCVVCISRDWFLAQGDIMAQFGFSSRAASSVTADDILIPQWQSDQTTNGLTTPSLTDSEVVPVSSFGATFTCDLSWSGW
jgi:hypothetical protein